MNNINVNRLLRLLPNFLWPVKLFVMRKLIKSVGKRVKFSAESHFDNFDKVHIGNDVFINRNFHCSNEKNLYIRDRVLLGPNCSIIAGDHDYSNPLNNMRHTHFLGDNREVVIEEDAWIGQGTTILKRAYIAEGCIIGACSLINTRLMPYCVYAGNPAKLIKPRFKTFEDLVVYLDMMKEKYNFKSNYPLEVLKEIYKQ